MVEGSPSKKLLPIISLDKKSETSYKTQSTFLYNENLYKV